MGCFDDYLPLSIITEPMNLFNNEFIRDPLDLYRSHASARTQQGGHQYQLVTTDMSYIISSLRCVRAALVGNQ